MNRKAIDIWFKSICKLFSLISKRNSYSLGFLKMPNWLAKGALLGSY